MDLEQLTIENLTNFPQKTRDYKVVQIEIQGIRFLRFETGDTQRHKYILNKILDELDIEYVPIQKNGSWAPPPTNNEYKVFGMGFCDVNIETKSIIYYLETKSEEYQINLDEEFMDSIEEEYLRIGWKLKSG